jgi:hypothetical protein
MVRPGNALIFKRVSQPGENLCQNGLIDDSEAADPSLLVDSPQLVEYDQAVLPAKAGKHSERR